MAYRSKPEPREKVTGYRQPQVSCMLINQVQHQKVNDHCTDTSSTEVDVSSAPTKREYCAQRLQQPHEYSLILKKSTAQAMYFRNALVLLNIKSG